MTYNFEGKVAIVSGGASGIGAETVKLLIEGGASVVVADIDLDKATEFTEELKKMVEKLHRFGRMSQILMMQRQRFTLLKKLSVDCI